MSQSNKQSISSETKHQQWQLRLLPFMVRIIIGLAFFFFIASMYQLYELNIKIEKSPELDESSLIIVTGDNPLFIEKQWRSLVLLESHILQQRYHQANVLIMARIWVRYLGFVTGMMLSLIGAVFILGKLREPSTELSLGGESSNNQSPASVKMQLVTQSPGIVLVSLGVLLMLITILVHHPIEVNDAPVYTAVTPVGSISENRSPPDIKFNQVDSSPNEAGDQTMDLMEQLRQRSTEGQE